MFDEQDLGYLARIPQFIGQFEYTTKQINEILWSTYVSPTYFVPGSVKITGNEITGCEVGDKIGTWDSDSINELQPTILNYISSFFVYWTGSLVYTFRFVKTDYHSGRIEISFHPFTNDVRKDRINYAYRAVIDLRDTTEVSLTIPYVAPQPWKRVLPASPLSDAKWEQFGPGTTGRLVVRAITPLIRSSAVVYDKVHCVIEVRAGDDFRLQTPVATSYLGFTLNNLRIGEEQVEEVLESESSECEEWHPWPNPNRPDGRWPGCEPPGYDEVDAWEQSGPVALPGTAETRTSAIEGFNPPSITTSEIDTHRTDTQMLCAGEIFTNFRSLIKKFAFVRLETNFRTWNNSMTISAAPYIRAPRLRGIHWKSGSSGAVISANEFQFEWGHSLLSQIGMMYAFYRGSVRYKIYAPQTENLISGRCVNKYDLIRPKIVYGDANVFNVDTNVFNPINANIAFELPTKQFAEFQLPFYSPVMLAVPNDIDRQTEFDQSSCALNISFYTPRKLNAEADPPVLQPDEKHVTNVHIAVAAGDDTTFHTFMGLPPMISKLRFSNLLTEGRCSADPDESIKVTPFQQLYYSGYHGAADPTLDTTHIYGDDWVVDANSDADVWLGLGGGR